VKIIFFTLIISLLGSASEVYGMSIRDELYKNIQETLKERDLFIESFLEGRVDIAVEQIESLFHLDEPAYKIGSWPKEKRLQITTQVFNDISEDFHQSKCSITKNDLCTKLIHQYLGYYAALKDQSENIVKPSVDYKQTKMMVLRGAENIQNQRHQVMIHSEQYRISKDPTYLRSLLFTWKRAMSLKMFKSDELIIEELKEEDLKKATNLFTIAYYTLRQSLDARFKDDQYRTMQIAAITMDSIKDMIYPYLANVSENPKDRIQFNYTKFYLYLGALEEYFKMNGNSSKELEVKILRGWAKSNSKSLTPSCFSRFVSKMWGALTGFGTSVRVPSTILLTLVLIIFFISGLDVYSVKFNLQNILNESLKYFTVSKHKENACFYKSVIEAVWLFYFPMYLSYLVAFFTGLF
jgi:hypothetical protein